MLCFQCPGAVVFLGDQATHQTRGPALRVMGFGGCKLRMTAAGAQYTVAAGRRRLQGGISGTRPRSGRLTATTTWAKIR
eukprot:COSAG01_NODE_42630_length_438_cov_0.651917_1_plen_78_part_01